jgi:hypothetical protein
MEAEEEHSGSLEESATAEALGFDFFTVRLPGAMVGVSVCGCTVWLSGLSCFSLWTVVFLEVVETKIARQSDLRDRRIPERICNRTSRVSPGL